MTTATFEPTAPQAIVEAALACPVCLQPSHWQNPANDHVLHCTCVACGHVHEVELSGPQLLRLTVPDDAADGLIIGGWREQGWPAL